MDGGGNATTHTIFQVRCVPRSVERYAAQKSVRTGDAGSPVARLVRTNRLGAAQLVKSRAVRNQLNLLNLCYLYRLLQRSISEKFRNVFTIA